MGIGVISGFTSDGRKLIAKKTSTRAQSNLLTKRLREHLSKSSYIVMLIFISFCPNGQSEKIAPPCNKNPTNRAAEC